MKKIFSAPNITRIIILAAIVFFLFVACSYGSCPFYSTLEASFVSLAPKAVVVGILFVLVKLVTSSIKLVLEKRQDSGKSNIFGALGLVRYGLWIAFTVISATIIFGDIGAIVTSLGLIGFGITFALQKPIMNFVGWLSIRFHKIFETGDRIRIQDIRGDVVEVNMMHTIVKSLLEGTDQHSGKLVSIPNELVLTVPVENYTKDNNFVKAEIKISVTYESDWKKARDMLEQIVTEVTRKNVHRFKSNITKRISIIDATIDKLSSRVERTDKKERENRIKDKITNLQEEKKALAETFVDMPGQFRPKVYIEMADSAIILSSIFMTPFDSVRATKTEINQAFLNAVRKEGRVEIAYPHMKLLLDSSQHASRNTQNLADFLGIDTVDVPEEDEKGAGA